MATDNPTALLDRLLKEPAENPWLEFKKNNTDPQMIGRCISACANAAILAGVERAFLVWGIEDDTKKKVGTNLRLRALKKGGENFVNWISRAIDPHLMMEFLDFEAYGMQFCILTVEPTYDKPVRFSDVAYIRIGENVKKLSDFPEYERAIWMATARHKFEGGIALPHQKPEEILRKLDSHTYYSLSNTPQPTSPTEIIRRFVSEGFLFDDMEGGYDITNLGAILLARDIRAFPSIVNKSVRVIKYEGRDKRKSVEETEGQKGYAAGFEGLMSFAMDNLPKVERYINGIRKTQPVYPETAIREIIANALIHQDFTVSGSGPVVEIYDDRIEVTNPGNSLIEQDRMIDERRSRNEKLAKTMRNLGICEERGGGLDKAIFAIEEMRLPAPDFISSEHSMRTVIFGPKDFKGWSKAEKQRACFFHCVLRWIAQDYMNNSSLRNRFSLDDDDYQIVSGIITESVRLGKIVPADPKQGNRYAKYVPYWARQ